MNEFDIKKLTASPTNQWEAIDALIKKEQELIAALHIMQSIIDNQEDEFKDLHIERINSFLNKFKITQAD